MAVGEGRVCDVSEVRDAHAACQSREGVGVRTGRTSSS